MSDHDTPETVQDTEVRAVGEKERGPCHPKAQTAEGNTPCMLWKRACGNMGGYNPALICFDT